MVISVMSQETNKAIWALNEALKKEGMYVGALFIATNTGGAGFLVPDADAATKEVIVSGIEICAPQLRALIFAQGGRA